MLINVDPFAREYLGIMFACLCRDDLLHSVFPPNYLPTCVPLRVVRLRNSGVVVVSPDFVSSRISSSLLSHGNEDLGFLEVSLHLSRTPMPRPPVTDDRHKLFGCMDMEQYPPC
jgi:hypothetical protein